MAAKMNPAEEDVESPEPIQPSTMIIIDCKPEPTADPEPANKPMAEPKPEPISALEPEPNKRSDQQRRPSRNPLPMLSSSSVLSPLAPPYLLTPLAPAGIVVFTATWEGRGLPHPSASTLTDHSQGNRTSGIRTASTGIPQGCVLSPLLYTIFTYDCVACQTNTRIIKFADDTTVIGLITGGEKTSYRREMAGLLANLSLNVQKTKEMIIDRRRRKEQHTPIYIGETEVERVKTFKFLGTYISEDFTWSHNTQQQRLRKFGMASKILSNFYRCSVESVITSSITVCNGSCAFQDRKALQHVIKTAQFICGVAFP
ncbi:hypothetical protein PO909_021331 [Leuciscus waleckii]